MLSLHEAMQLDFAAGVFPDMDVGFGLFGIDAAEFLPSYVTASDAAGLSPAVIGVPDIAGDDGNWSGGGDPHLLYGERGREEEERRRRMRRKISNRESARRSRARRRQRVEELERAADALRGEKRALAARLHATARRALAVRGENARLHAEAGILRRRLAEAQRSAAVLIGLSRLVRTTANGHGGAAPAPAVTPQSAGGVASVMT